MAPTTAVSPTASTTLATSSQAIDTSNWLTYSNNKYGYTIDYPEQAQYSIVGSETDPGGVRFQLETALGVNYQLPGTDSPKNETRFFVYITANHIDNPSNLSVKDWVEANELSSQPEPGAPSPSLKQETILAGYPAYYLEYNVGAFEVSPYVAVFYWIIRGDTLYRIYGLKVPQGITSLSALPYAKKDDPSLPFAEKYEPVFEAMLNSFQFTNASSS
jgi:hypothetical protein